MKIRSNNTIISHNTDNLIRKNRFVSCNNMHAKLSYIVCVFLRLYFHIYLFRSANKFTNLNLNVHNDFRYCGVTIYYDLTEKKPQGSLWFFNSEMCY